MSTALQDLRFGLRTLLRNKTFTAVAILSIALGIAVNATVFGWMESVLMHPFPGVQRGQDLFVIKSTVPGGYQISCSYPDFKDFSSEARTIAGAIAFNQRVLFLGDPPRMELFWSQMVSGNYFDVLGVKPLLGRTFSIDEQNAGPGAAPVVVISERVWRSRFQSNPAAIGKTVKLNRQPFQLIGVVPDAFRGTMPGLKIEMWAPITMETQLSGDPDWRWIDNRSDRRVNVLARLSPGAAVAQANAEIAGIAARLAKTYPQYESAGAVALPVGRSPDGAQAYLGAPLKVLLGVALLVLLIVCANVGNLLLARAIVRRKEFAIRLSLGAGRGRLVRQLLTESLMLSLAGAGLGVLGANWLYSSLAYMLPASEMPASLDVGFDGPAMIFTVGLCVVTALLCGLAPALQFYRADLQDALRQSGRGTSAAGGAIRLRGVLVASEVALALVALIGAGLFSRSYDRAKRIDPGFDPHKVLLAQIDLTSSGCADTACSARVEAIRRRLAEVPGVEAVASADHVPLGFGEGGWDQISVPGYTPQKGESMLVHRMHAGPGYFGLMRIPLAQGREFDAGDDNTRERVAIVNEAFVKRFFGGGNVIGRKFQTARVYTIVGVVGDIKYRHIVESPMPLFFRSMGQGLTTADDCVFMIRTRQSPVAMMMPVDRELRKVEGGVAIDGVMPMEHYIGAGYLAEAVAAGLLSVLGSLSVILALLGLYGVMVYTTAQRTQELGIRIAIGATPRDVSGLVVRDGLWLAIQGLAAGFVLAFFGSRIISSLLYGASRADGFIYVAMSALVLAMAAVVSYIPARRAARLDPMLALRQE